MTDTVPLVAPLVESPERVIAVPLTKPLWKSWTILVNVLSIALLILNQISPFTTFFIHNQTDAKNVSDLIAGSIVVINLLLRFKTNSQVNLGFKIVKTS